MGAKMTNLLPVLADLQRQEKLFVIQFLVSELAQQEKTYLMPDTSYPVWTPFEAHGAAAVLMKLLEDNKQ